jgi:hypothetical protein
MCPVVINPDASECKKSFCSHVGSFQDVACEVKKKLLTGFQNVVCASKNVACQRAKCLMSVKKSCGPDFKMFDARQKKKLLLPKSLMCVKK